MRTPDFWYVKNPGLLAAALWPASQAVRLAGRLRNAVTRPWEAFIPVLCVGNAVAGGAGKTPVAVSLAKRLIERGVGVHFLTRGYGGSLAGPVKVEANKHTYTQTGDEALLLARTAPTWIAHDRRSGIRAATLDGAGAVIMDDGLQNPSVRKTVSVLVADGTFGFGNGKLVPAGPMREPLSSALDKCQAVVLIGEDRAGVIEAVKAASATPPPILRARLDPGPEAEHLIGARVVAFAGIGLPQKFFDTLGAVGCTVIESHAFADHHPYTAADIANLREKAEAANARLITTEKDAVRLAPADRAGVTVLPVSLTWLDEFAVDDLLDTLLPEVPAR